MAATFPGQPAPASAPHRAVTALPALVALAVLAGAPTGAGAQERIRCEVDFVVDGLPQDTLVGFADLEIGYLRPKIFPLDPTGEVRCRGLVPGSAVDGANRFDGPSDGTLDLAVASETGAGEGLARCDVFASSPAVPADFPSLEVVRARDTNLAPVDPLPALSLGRVFCAPPPPTTLPPPSTTLAGPGSTTTTLSPSTTLAPGPERCSFGLRFQAAGKLRRIRVDVDYSAADGDLPPSPPPACVGAAGFATGEIVDAPSSTVALETVSTLATGGPVEFATCAFLRGPTLASPTDFVATALLAGDATGAGVAPLPTVTATGLRCPSQTTSTTTTTSTLPPPLCGDADGDGKLEASDALAALKTAVGLPTPCPPARCDVDSSGEVRTTDALRILQASVGLPVLLLCTA